MILRAKIVLPVSSAPIGNGAVAVEGDRIVGVGAAKDVAASHTGETRDLGSVVLLPGLINAHCHLDYTDMAGKIKSGGSFIDWLRQITELKNALTEADFLAAIDHGLDQLAKSGTTSVVNIEAYPQLVDRVNPHGLRIWWCPELIDFQTEVPPEKLFKSVVAFIANRDKTFGGIGVSPHAPYTVSSELYRLTARWAREQGAVLTTHVAESEEEDDMIRRGTGTMYDWFRRAGRDMSDCKRFGVVQLLSEYGVFDANCLAAHANCLTPADVTLLKHTQAHVVQCPNTHRYFRRGLPNIEELWQAGINVCLGTDSLASNNSLTGLSMFDEMMTLANMFPRLAPETFLRLATVCGAKALNREDQLGKIAPGAAADLIAVPFEGLINDPYEVPVFNEKPVSFSMVGGKMVVG